MQTFEPFTGTCTLHVVPAQVYMRSSYTLLAQRYPFTSTFSWDCGPAWLSFAPSRNGLFVVGSRRDLTVGISPFDHLTRLLMTFFADLSRKLLYMYV